MYKQMEKTDNEHYEEDENLKKVSIEEFTRFVKKHPYISSHNEIEDVYVLAFLRARRYLMPKAKELYERACIFVKQNPEICEINEETFNKTLELYDSGAISIMKERDAFGRRIILCVTKKFDTTKYTIDDTMRLFSLILTVLSLEDETQKYGTIFINDLNGLSASHLKLFPYKMLTNYSSFMNISVIRIKEIYVVGMPSIAVQLFKAVRFVLDEKNRNRLQVMSDIGNLWNFVDQNIMTKEYGGRRYSESETLSDFKNIIIANKYKIMELTNNFEINLDIAKKFHKIKIDKTKGRGSELLEID